MSPAFVGLKGCVWRVPISPPYKIKPLKAKASGAFSLCVAKVVEVSSPNCAGRAYEEAGSFLSGLTVSSTPKASMSF